MFTNMVNNNSSPHPTPGGRCEVIKHIFSYEGDVLIRTEEAEPICGEDFCDSCGDCLACYGDEPCFYNALGHYWVKYEELPKKQGEVME